MIASRLPRLSNGKQLWKVGSKGEENSEGFIAIEPSENAGMTSAAVVDVAIVFVAVVSCSAGVVASRLRGGFPAFLDNPYTQLAP